MRGVAMKHGDRSLGVAWTRMRVKADEQGRCSQQAVAARAWTTELRMYRFNGSQRLTEDQSCCFLTAGGISLPS